MYSFYNKNIRSDFNELSNKLNNYVYSVWTTVPSSENEELITTLPEGWSDACLIGWYITQGIGLQTTFDLIFRIDGAKVYAEWKGHSYWYGKSLKLYFI